MSSSEKFCLRWNDFETNISVAFRELREEKDFFDVTLACDDSQIQAHKVILSACSPFFRNVLRRNPHQHPLLYLKGVKYKELLSVLNFMYMGEVNVAQEELNSFLAVAEDLRVKGLTQNNSSSDTAAVAASKPKQEPPKIIPRPRDPPERDPVPPPKRPRPTPPVNAPAPAQSYPAYDDDDIQEVVPVKSEPRDPAPSPMAVHHATPLDNSHSVSQYEVVQQQQAAPTPMDQNTVALDETYGDESYDYGQYGDGSYDDGSGMIDPNTGMPMQGAGPDGNKDLYDIIRSKIQKSEGQWICLECGKASKWKTNIFEHIEATHVDSPGYQCEICYKACKTKNALRSHKNREHKENQSQYNLNSYQ
eukprot:GFUD01135280.1.p1 GENE.GFUD01135280.1~~GFUD01135280.1.p1  ORF type:complete len:362 (-),score=79.29 GFUD01135280.1:169-1254(-)